MKIQDLKVGEYFKRKETSKEIYTRQEYCRYNKKYTGDAESDISKQIYLKKDTIVFIDFEY